MWSTSSSPPRSMLSMYALSLCPGRPYMRSIFMFSNPAALDSFTASSACAALCILPIDLSKPLSKALNAYGDPVEARPSVCFQLVHINRARVALYCSLGHFQIKVGSYAFHCGAYKLERYCRRRTSSEKYRIEFFAAALCRGHRYLLIKRLEIRVCPALFREGNKVAVGALLNAEGDVQIYSRHFSLCGARS